MPPEEDNDGEGGARRRGLLLLLLLLPLVVLVLVASGFRLPMTTAFLLVQLVDDADGWIVMIGVLASAAVVAGVEPITSPLLIVVVIVTDAGCFSGVSCGLLLLLLLLA